jgi:hypothetical protein
MNLKTPLKDLNRSELLRLNSALKNVCELILGKKNGIIIRTYNKSNNNHFAYYDYNDCSIRIFRKDIKTVDFYVKVFIHEWTHSLQKGLKRKYSLMVSKYGYWNNPYEIEARENEKLFKSIVWKMVKKSL